MEHCRYCDATFSSRQSRWRHVKNTCPNSDNSFQNGRVEVRSVDTSYVSDSSNYNGGSGRSAERYEESEKSSTSDEEMNEHVSETESAIEMGEGDEKRLNTYADMLTMQLCEDAENEKEFKLQVVEEVRRNKALRSARWFQEINSQVNHLVNKGYDIDEAINVAVRKRKFLLKDIFHECKNKQVGAQRLERYNNTITNYA